MTRIMYDSTTVDAIPRDATAVAGYVGGNFHTFPTLRRRFRKANKLSIAVNASEDAACLDVEPGDATPGEVVSWVLRQHARGEQRPVIYASRDNMPAVIDALEQHGMSRASVRLWSAHYGAGAHICGAVSCGAGFTADATQWTDKALGRNLDESLLADTFFPAKTKAKAKVKLPAKPHPKVTAATVAAGLVTAILGVLHGAGLVHLTPAETSSITTAAAGIAGYVKKAS